MIISSIIVEFPRSFLRLLRNKPYIVNVGCTICFAYMIVVVLANTVRYVEIHFNERAFVGSLIAGAVTVVFFQ
jgi:riboflavin transporter FmnP